MNKKTKKPVKKSSSIGKLVKIDWNDHYSYNGAWIDPNEREWKPHLNSSVGKVVKEDTKSIVLATSWSNVNNNVSDPIYILKGCIVKRKILK